MLFFIIKAMFLFTLIFFVCPLIFVTLAILSGRFFKLTIAPDSLVARIQQKFLYQNQK